MRERGSFLNDFRIKDVKFLISQHFPDLLKKSWVSRIEHPHFYIIEFSWYRNCFSVQKEGGLKILIAFDIHLYKLV